MKSVLIVYHQEKFDDFVEEVQKFLSSKGITHSIKERECMTFDCYKEKDLVLVIGGDGTFLRASHLNKDIPMFGINPDPKRKEGFFMQSTKEDYIEKLKPILNDKFETIDLLRLKTTINDRDIDELILNEVYIGDLKPYNVFNYNIKIDNKEEFQRGSGILIGTPAGSHAWLKSAGGQVMDITNKKFQYVSRELYDGKLLDKYKLKKGILGEHSIIEITPKTPGMLVIDSISDEHTLNRDDKITIRKGDFLKYIKNIKS